MPAGLSILTAKALSEHQLEECRYLLERLKISGSLLGALPDKKCNRVLPIILAGRQLKILKVTPQIIGEDKVLINYLDELQKKTKQFGLSGKNIEFGQINDSYYLLRDYHQVTLSDFLKNNRLDATQANLLLVKLVNLLLSLKRHNTPHGHLFLGNLSISDNQVALLDFGLGFCTKKATHADSLPPEAAHTLTPDFPADVYGLGKVINLLYQGLSNPVPASFLTKMTDAKPSNRPNIFEVNQVVTDAFTESCEQELEILPKEQVGQDVTHDNPYLTPEVLDQIRVTLSKDKQVETKPTSSKNPQVVAGGILGLLVLLVVALLVLRSGDEAPSDVATQVEATEENLEALPQELKFAILFLKQAPDIAYQSSWADTLKQYHSSGYQEKTIQQFIPPADPLQTKLNKLKALIIIFASNPSHLDAIYKDLEELQIIQPYTAWFGQYRQLLDWSIVNNPLKLLIVTGSVSKVLIDYDYCFDLTKHFDPLIATAAKEQLQNLYPANQKNFYKALYEESDLYSRDQLLFLLRILKQKDTLRGPLVDQWFKNTKPSQKSVLKLVLARKAIQNEEDYFSFYGARYLKQLDFTPSAAELKAMGQHHETQIRNIAEVLG